MTIIMIEATAEELSANRTIMETFNDVLNKFSNKLCGVNNIDYVKALSEMESKEDTEEYDS